MITGYMVIFVGLWCFYAQQQPAVSLVIPAPLSSIHRPRLAVVKKWGGSIPTSQDNGVLRTRAHNSSSSRLSMSSRAATTKVNGRKRLATAMAFLAGWADILFYTKFKTFGSMLTGNTMQMALAATSRNYRDLAYYTTIVISYLFGTAAFRRADLSLRKRTLPVCSVAVATLFILGDWIHYGTLGATWLPMMMFATAFGITNSLGTEVSGTLTFVVTGHLTRLVNMLVDRLSRTAGRQKLSEAQRTAVVQNSAICGGFVAGAAFATLLLRRGLLHRVGVFSVVGVLHAILWMAHDMEALDGAWWLRKDKALCDLDDDGQLCVMDDDENEPTNGSTLTNTRMGDSDADALKP